MVTAVTLWAAAAHRRAAGSCCSWRTPSLTGVLRRGDPRGSARGVVRERGRRPRQRVRRDVELTGARVVPGDPQQLAELPPRRCATDRRPPARATTRRAPAGRRRTPAGAAPCASSGRARIPSDHQRPRIGATWSGAPSSGLQVSGARGRASSTASARSSASASGSRRRARDEDDRSGPLGAVDATPARNPGIAPPWPTKTRSPRRYSSRPSPQPSDQRSWSTIVLTRAISSSVSRASTPSLPVARKSAHRARSSTVDQSHPIAAVGPSTGSSASTVTASEYGSTEVAGRLRAGWIEPRPVEARADRARAVEARLRTPPRRGGRRPRRAGRRRGWSSAASPAGARAPCPRASRAAPRATGASSSPRSRPAARAGGRSGARARRARSARRGLRGCASAAGRRGRAPWRRAAGGCRRR